MWLLNDIFNGEQRNGEQRNVFYILFVIARKKITINQKKIFKKEFKKTTKTSLCNRKTDRLLSYGGRCFQQEME